MINNEIKQFVRDMKIETISDTSTFQELESIASELLNSDDTGNKLLAMRIKNRLNENPNYQNFIKQTEIEQQLAKTENEQKIAKQQEIRQVNATSNIEKKKAEQKQNETKEKEVIENFKKISETQQKIFLEIEKSFPTEHRQALRNFALTSGTATEKRQQNVDLLNKAVGKNILEIKNGKADVKDGTTYDELSQAIPVQDKITEAAIVAKNTTAALEAVHTRTTIGTEQAVIKTKEKDEIISLTSQCVIGSDEHNKIETERHSNTLKTKQFLEELKHNQTLKEYDEDLNKIREFGDESEIKAKEKEIAEDFIEKMKKAGIDPEKIDQKIMQDYINHSELNQSSKDLLNNTVLQNAKNYAKHDEDLKNYQENFKKEQNQKIEAAKQVNANKPKEEQLKEIYENGLTGQFGMKYETEEQKNEVIEVAKSQGYSVTKEELNNYVKKQREETKLYNQATDSVDARREKDGTAAEAQQEIHQKYNPNGENVHVANMEHSSKQ